MQKPTLDSTARFPALMRNQNPTRIQVKIETPCNSPIDVIHKKFKEVSQSLTIKNNKLRKKEAWRTLI